MTHSELVGSILDRLRELDDKGHFVGDVFFSRIDVADLARRNLASRLALRGDDTRTSEYLAAVSIFRESNCALGCCYCNRSFASLEDAAVLSGRQLIHRRGCKAEYEQSYNAWLDASFDITDAGRQALAEDSEAA